VNNGEFALFTGSATSHTTSTIESASSTYGTSGVRTVASEAADLGRGRFHVCEGCEWAGDGHEAESVVEDGVPGFQCPECGGSTHREYFGNPIRRKEPHGRRRSGSISALPAEPPEISSPTSRASAFAERSAAVSQRRNSSRRPRGEQDVIIRASEADLRHKVFDYMDLANNDIEPRRSLAYWRVNRTPQRTGPGRTIMFSTDGETVDFDAPICTTEEGKIWFDFLRPTSYEVPVEPPTRGFRYFEWRDYRW